MLDWTIKLLGTSRSLSIDDDVLTFWKKTNRLEAWINKSDAYLDRNEQVETLSGKEENKTETNEIINKTI